MDKYKVEVHYDAVYETIIAAESGKEAIALAEVESRTVDKSEFKFTFSKTVANWFDDKWKPQFGDKYWYFSSNFREIHETTWLGVDDEIEQYKSGNCFKTFDEACEKSYEILKILNRA